MYTPQETEIVVEHQSLHNIGPSYSLRIDGGGNVEFDGKSKVKTLGKHTWKISAENLNQIVFKFDDIYFTSLDDSYGLADQLNSQKKEQVTVSYRSGDEHKTVKY